MLSNQVLLKIISDIKGITGAMTSVWDLEGACIIATDYIEETQINLVQDFLFTELEGLEESVTVGTAHLRLINIEETPQYILLFEGLEGDAEVLSALCASQMENLITAYKEPLNKNTFIYNLLSGNLAKEDIVSKSKRVHIQEYAKRVVFVVEPKNDGEEIVSHTLKSLYVTGITDFVVEMDKTHIAFVKELNSTDTERDIHHMAETIADTLSAETMLYVRVSYGTTVDTLGEVKKSYEEAKMALEVGRSFYASKTVLAYKALGIGRLIHQLPTKLCDEFLQEVLCGNGLAQFDEETMLAAYHFFENNLNISETARQLYVHRNTLMYRLEKIQKKTGLDVRVFDDAMTFKLALMVSAHVNFTLAK